MSIDPELLKILVCPDSKRPVTVASDTIVANVNEKIRQGLAKNKGGAKLTDLIDGGLLRDDGKVLYPVMEDIPIMLIEEGIEL